MEMDFTKLVMGDGSEEYLKEVKKHLPWWSCEGNFKAEGKGCQEFGDGEEMMACGKVSKTSSPAEAQPPSSLNCFPPPFFQCQSVRYCSVGSSSLFLSFVFELLLKTDFICRFP